MRRVAAGLHPLARRLVSGFHPLSPLAPLATRPFTAVAAAGDLHPHPTPAEKIPYREKVFASLSERDERRRLLREARAAPAKMVPLPWNPTHRRVGAIMRKIGMMRTWNELGTMEVLTVLRLEECQVTAVRYLQPKPGKYQVNVQVGAGKKMNLKYMRKQQLTYFRMVGVEPKEKLVEFPVSADAVLPVGFKITARHFRVGQLIDTIAVTKGKGFAGVMKRHGMKGQGASHGNSLSHRSQGSTGSCQWPGRVWPGKRMAGHMGNTPNTQLNSQIYKIDVEKDLIFVRGSISGPQGTMVVVRDAIRPASNKDPTKPLPFPSFVAGEKDGQVDELVLDMSHLEDPFETI